MLSSAQQADYRRDGFLVLPGFVSLEACAELKAEAEALVDGFEPDAGVKSIFTTNEQTRHSDEYFLTSGDTTRFFFEEEAFDEDGGLRQAKALSINKLGHAMHDLDPVFERFSHTADLAEVCTDLGYEDPSILQSMYIFKQPRIGGEVTSHTDHTFLWTEPQSVTGFWFAIEEATLENGCMWALPGGQEIPVKQRFRRDGEGGTAMDVLDASPYPEDGLVPLEAGAGTLIVLHGALPHRSGPNRSDRSRHAYTLHVIERGADYPEDNWLQRPTLPLRPVAWTPT
ncbi:MAG: phytanoyl-CoA dioxygenase family protein [Acidimicrobiales bacterium]